MDTGPELSRICLITPGLSRGVRRMTGFLEAGNRTAGGINFGGNIMCGLITFLIVIMAFPLMVVFSIAMLLALTIVVSPFIFVGWLIGELYKNE